MRIRLPIASALAFALLLGGLPLLSGLGVGAGQCAFTLDICHPVQTVVHSSPPCIPSGGCGFEATWFECGAAPQAILPLVGRAADPPEPHPPEGLA